MSSCRATNAKEAARRIALGSLLEDNRGRTKGNPGFRDSNGYPTTEAVASAIADAIHGYRLVRERPWGLPPVPEEILRLYMTVQAAAIADFRKLTGCSIRDAKAAVEADFAVWGV